MSSDEMSLKQRIEATGLVQEKLTVNSKLSSKSESLGIVYSKSAICLKIHENSIEKLGNPSKLKFTCDEEKLYIINADDNDAEAYDVPQKNKSKFRIFYNAGLVSGIVEAFNLKYTINTPENEFDESNDLYSKSSKSFKDVTYEVEETLRVMIVKMI